MRTPGKPAELAHRRLLAVERVLEGYPPEEVATFLGIDPSSVRRWVRVFRRQGRAGLAARPVPGRPPKLSPAQEKVVRRWLAHSPTEHGFATELWSARRLAQVIEQEMDLTLHPGYLCAWLRERGYTPQKPHRVAREHDDEAVARWLSEDWPRMKKTPAGVAPASCCWTKAGC
jgi:transposase